MPTHRKPQSGSRTMQTPSEINPRLLDDAALAKLATKLAMREEHLRFAWKETRDERIGQQFDKAYRQHSDARFVQMLRAAGDRRGTSSRS